MNTLNTNEDYKEPTSKIPDWNRGGDGELPGTDLSDESYMPSGGTKNRGMMILMATCVLGMAVVYFLGSRQKAPEPTEQEKTNEAQIDVALAKLVNNGQVIKLLKDTEMMVKTFYEYPSNKQVALDDLQKNPFSRIADSSLDGGEVDAAIKKSQLETEYSKKIEDLELQSIIQSPQGDHCLVNGEVFALNQKIEGVFSVTSISKDSVILEAQGIEFTLQM